MRTITVLAAVVSLGLSMMIIGGLGVSDYLGSSGETGLQKAVNDSANSEDSLNPDEGDDGGFFSFVAGAINTMRDTFGLLVFLPSTLASLGLPDPAARAIGHSIQLIVTIALVQIAIQFTIE